MEITEQAEKNLTERAPEVEKLGPRRRPIASLRCTT